MTDDRYNEIVETVIRWIESEDKKNQAYFLNEDPNKLIRFHHNLGRSIRNEFDLWSEKWTPEIQEGVDMSPHHPDAVSMRIIKDVHERMNNE